MVEQQVVRALLDHQHDPARARPGAGLVLQLVQPQPRLDRWPSRWALQIRPGQPIESAVVTQPGDIGRAARLQPGEQPLLGEAGVHAHRRNLAHRAFQAVNEVEDEVERAFGGVRVAGPQPGIQQVTRLRRAGDYRVIHTLVVVPVPG